MENMKVPELKAEAKRLGLNNYSRLKKQELIDLLNNQTERTDDKRIILEDKISTLSYGHYKI